MLVIGGGARSIGLYAVDFARALGAGEIAYVDTDADRLALAAELGAEAIEGLERKYRRRQITVNAAVTHEGLHAALRSTARGGICTNVGIFYEEMTPMPVLEMYTAGIRFVTGRVAARPVIPPILDLTARGEIQPREGHEQRRRLGGRARGRAGGGDEARDRARGRRVSPRHLWTLTYDYVPDIVERRAPHREAHLAHVAEWHERGELVVAGAVGDPPHGALFAFDVDDEP